MTCAATPTTFERGESVPERIQMSRQRPWRAEHPDAVIVDRTTAWGNPWRIAQVACDIDSPCWGTTVPDLFGDPVTFHEHHTTKASAAQAVVTAFRHAILWPVSRQPRVPDLDDVRRDLAGKDLACWCPLDAPCHADVLLELANAPRCPECRDGKCGNCVEQTLDADDNWVPCGCPNHRKEIG